MNSWFAAERLASTRPVVTRNTRFFAQLLHFAAASLPGLLFAWLQVQGIPVEAELGGFSLITGVMAVVFLSAFGQYGGHFFSNRLLFLSALWGWSAAFGLMMLMRGAFGFGVELPLRLGVFWYLATLLTLVAGRLAMLAFFGRMLARGYFVGRSVILGGTDNGVRLAAHMREHGDLKSGLLGFVDDRISDRFDLPGGERYLGKFADLQALIRRDQVDQVLVALPASAMARNLEYARQLRKLPVRVLLVPQMESFNYAMTRVTHIAEIPMMVIAEPPMQGWAPLYKRCEDIALASLMLLLLAPLMLLIAVAIKLDSPGPVLFRQKRYGYNQQLIEVYKFRSMYHQMRDANAEQQTTRKDSRVTRVGAFIRRSSLDELPQLLNALGGSMSLVGPRPHATSTKVANVRFEEAVSDYVARYRVKPGITGLAQVNGYRGETDTLEKIQRRVEYDLAYIENWSVWLDLYIVVRTGPAVLSMRGAY